MSEQNKATARRLLEEIISTGNLDAIGEVVATDYHEHDPANEVDTRGADGMRREFEMFRSAFGLQFTVEDQVAEGDQVATRWSARGTHTGEFGGIAASGNQVAITGHHHLPLRRRRDPRRLVELGHAGHDASGRRDPRGAARVTDAPS